MRQGSQTAGLKYYFSLLSDWAYMGGERLESLALRHNVPIEYRPMNLADLYDATGGIILQMRSAQRQKYREVELKRWAGKLGMPIILHPDYYPANDKLASQIIVVSIELGLNTGVLVNRLHRAIWAENRNIADEHTLTQIVGGMGWDSEKLIALAKHDKYRQQVEENTRQAAEDGVFGSPFYLFESEIYWGQDRLEILEQQICAHQSLTV